MARGDLGTSYQQHLPVREILEPRIWSTAKLGGAAIAIQLLLGTIVGVLAALKRGTLLDHGTIAITLVGISAPTFLTGLILQYWMAYRWRLVPFDGFGRTWIEQWHSLVLPATTLGLFGAALLARFVRDEFINIFHEDYMRTAKAKGLSPARILIVHGLRNALLPLTTIVGMDIGVVMGGAVVTEKLFRYPGIGALTVDAVLSRDGPVLMGIALVTSVAIVLANLAVDILATVMDPRTRRPASQT